MLDENKIIKDFKGSAERQIPTINKYNFIDIAWQLYQEFLGGLSQIEKGQERLKDEMLDAISEVSKGKISKEEAAGGKTRYALDKWFKLHNALQGAPNQQANIKEQLPKIEEAIKEDFKCHHSDRDHNTLAIKIVDKLYHNENQEDKEVFAKFLGNHIYKEYWEYSKTQRSTLKDALIKSIIACIGIPIAAIFSTRGKDLSGKTPLSRTIETLQEAWSFRKRKQLKKELENKIAQAKMTHDSNPKQQRQA